MQKPTAKPNCPNFSSGPCAKRPGWTPDALKNALTGRSHRSAPGKKALVEVIETHRRILGIPADYKVGIMPASDSGAVEAAMWSLLGERGVDAVAWESFGSDWQKDITGQLKLADVRVMTADYGQIVDLSTVDTDRDVIFTWNGTTSGVRVPNGDWIKSDRKGLTICDATSAVFAYDLPWDKLDVTTWSWQKVLGGEGAHGMLVLSPRAVERLQSYKPAWPLPKIFRLTKKDDSGKTVLNDAIFQGETINTPSMLAVEDCLDSLRWVDSIGGVKAAIQRTKDNLAVIEKWVAQSSWATFLPTDPAVRSRTSICLSIKDDWFAALPEDRKMPFIKDMTKTLDSENVAKDIASYKAAPAGLRIWGGATVEASDLEAILPWLDWAYALHKDAEIKKAA